MSLEQGQTPLLGSLDYLAEVAKDWVRYRFGTARRSDFTLAPCRFDLHPQGVRRRRVPANSAEAESLSVAAQLAQPTAWCRAAVTMRRVETSTGMVDYEQEIVARAPGLPPCLGGFQPIG